MRLRRRPLSSLVTCALLAAFLSVVSVPAAVQPAFADPVATGDEASVPEQPLATPQETQPEQSAPPLAAPTWPVASDKTVALSPVKAGSLVAGAPSGSVLSVGPAAIGVLGPVQAVQGAVTKPGSPDGVPVLPSVNPSTVDVRVLSHAQTLATGGQGLGVVVNRTDGSTATGALRVSINASGFAEAYGADYFGRLAMVELPACALTTPTVPGCQTATYVNTMSDRKTHTITGVIDVNPDPATVASPLKADGASVAPGGHVVVMTSGGSSDQGDFRATDLKASSTWSVSVGSGAFTYSIPISVPPPAEGSAPDLSLDYNSQTVDGYTSATNNQASVVGLGWDLNNAYVERRFRACSDDGQSSSEGDLCWYSPYQGTGSGHAGDEIYDIVLNGVSTNLIPDPTTANVFHLADDPGWYVKELTGASNGDDNGEWWQVHTPDGSVYDFGVGTDPRNSTATNSVLTEPVFGNNTGEPCHAASLSASVCTQAYRWMLDRVWQPNGIAAGYYYTPETNSYRSVLGTAGARTYTAADDLTEIDYGWASNITGANYTDKVVLTYHGRCSTEVAETDPLRHGTTITGPCPSISSDPGDYPDVPTDKICTASGSGSGCSSPVTSLSPVYFSTKMLYTIVTYTLTTGGTATQVMDYQLRHALPEPPNAIGKFLWFDYLQRQAGTGGSAIILPVISFDGTDFDNVVGSTDLEFRRITTAENDLGGITTVTYGLPDQCTTTSLPAEATNTKDCFKQQWTPEGGTLQTNWFNKYVVTEVDNDPNVGTGTGHDGDPVQTTTYTYASGKAGWRYPADPAQQRKDQSWTEWQGYSLVTVTHADGTGEEHSSAFWIFQGLDGDRLVLNPTGPSDYKSVTATGSSTGPSISFADSRYLAGKVYEQSNRSDTTATQQYIVNTYGFVYDTASYVGLYDSYMTGQTGTDTYSKISTSTSSISTWRHAETETFYDTSQNATKLFDLPIKTEDDGEIGQPDNSCVIYGYAVNTSTSVWMALVDDQAHYTGNCSGASGATEDGDTQTFYDNNTTLATNVPTAGNQTEVDTYSAASAHTTTTATYDAGGRILSRTDARGHVTTTSYSPVAGWPSSGTTVTTAPPDPSGVTGSSSGLATATVNAPSYGQTLTVTDPNGNVTTEQYDTAGRLTKVWKPAQPTTGSASMTYTYTIPTTSSPVPDLVNGPPKTATATLQSGSTYVTGYSYIDGLGQTRETQGPSPDGSGRTVVSTRYDVGGYTEGVSDPYYNSSAPGTSMVNPAVSSLPAYHDIVVDWAGRTTESKLDHLGTAVADGDTLTAYPGPDLTTVTDPDGNVTGTYTDVFGQTTSIAQHIPDIDAVHPVVTTSYTYTDKHQLATISDNSGDLTSYSYDWDGRVTSATDPDAGTTTTTYDADGDVKTTTDNNGQLLTHVYDRIDRQTALWLGAAGTGTELTSAAYDSATLGKGLLASSTSWNGSTTYVSTVDGYDADSNPTGTTITIPAAEGALAGSYDTTYTYNAADQPITITYPAVGSTGVSLSAETVTTGYTAQGLASALTSSLATYVSATGYANYGPLTSRTYGTGTLTATRGYTYSQVTGQVTGIATTVTNSGTPTTTQSDTYSYDPAGNVVEIASSVDSQQQCYSYDDLNRLSHAFTTMTASPASCAGASPDHTGGPSPYDISYNYDKLGDITSTVDAISSTTANYQYNAPAHVHAVTDVVNTGGSTNHDTYGYDLNGDQNTRVVAGNAGTVTWDAQQHLSSMTIGSSTTTFVYDAGGNRLLRKASGDNVLYLPGEELHANGTTVTPTRYYSDGGAVVAMRVGGSGSGTLTWLTADDQGSAQQAINSSTGATTQQRYLPFGAQRGAQGPPTGTNRGFLGHSADPTTGLVQDGARYYDATLGRFLGPDPLNSPYSPQNLNAYSYVTNNPETYIDPSGLSGCDPQDADECGVKRTTDHDTTGTQVCKGSRCGKPQTNICEDDVACATIDHEWLSIRSDWVKKNPTIAWEAYADPLTIGRLWIVLYQDIQRNYPQFLPLMPTAQQIIGYMASGAVQDGASFSPNTGAFLSLLDPGSDTSDDIGCDSFDPSTRVLMADGSTKAIKDVKIGDRVEATDPNARQTSGEAVVQLHDNVDTQFTDLTIVSQGKPSVLHTTQNHLIWDETTGEWTLASELRIGDHLLTTSGSIVSVKGVRNWSGQHMMLNLTVQDLHTFYVLAGAVSILVHNCSVGGYRIAVGGDDADYRDFQMAYTGAIEVKVMGGGEEVWADGIDGTVLLDAKYNGNKRSPFIPGSGVPDFIQAKIDANEADEMRRYAAVIHDPDSGFTALRIYTNNPAVVPYFQALMDQYDVPGTIVVVP